VGLEPYVAGFLIYPPWDARATIIENGWSLACDNWMERKGVYGYGRLHWLHSYSCPWFDGAFTAALRFKLLSHVLSTRAALLTQTLLD
jgi:hypothetical protein